MATKDKSHQNSSNTNSVDQLANLQLFEKLVDKLFRKDTVPPPKVFSDDKVVEEHVKNVNRYIQATGVTEEETMVSILLNSLDDDVQIRLFSQPGFDKWVCDKLINIFEKKRSPISPFATLLHIKQSNEMNLDSYAAELRIASYKYLKDTPENTKEIIS